MNAVELMAEVEQAGGKIWMDGDRLKFRAVPSRLVRLLKEHKAELLALLQAGPAEPLQESEAALSTYCATQSPAMQPRARKGPSRASMNDARSYGDNGVPILTPTQVRCADCNHVASTNGDAMGVRYCKITGTYLDVDHKTLIWGFQPRSCSRFETTPIFSARAGHVTKGDSS